MRKRALLAFGVSAAAGLAMLVPAAMNNAGAANVDGPFSYTGPDSGTCHPYDTAFNEVPWALDLGQRTFTVVSADPAGNYSVVEKFIKGKFSSASDPGPNGSGSLPPAGARKNYSPGDCDGSGGGGGADAGHRIDEGTIGTFTGNEHLFIQHGTYTAGDNTCAGEDSNGSPNPCTTYGYVQYHYGQQAADTLTLTKYAFTYKGNSQTYSDTYDGTNYHETGDIYTSTATPVSPAGPSHQHGVNRTIDR
jgi:hypothetical protein